MQNCEKENLEGG